MRQCVLSIAQFASTPYSLHDAVTTTYVAVTSQSCFLPKYTSDSRFAECSSKQRSGITTHSTQHIDCVCVPVLAGVHEGDDGRLDKHHPHTRFQWLGTCSTAAERQARLKGSRSGFLEQPGSSAGESGRLPASTLHQLSLELSLRIPKRVISSLSNLHWQTHVKASWHTKCVSHCNDVYMCNLV